jgi:tetratricopeptide (TPR) repeat protein
MNRLRVRLFCAATILLLATPASAQWEDEEEACEHALEGKALKLYEKGLNGSKYERSERVAFFEEAFDRDDQCMACLYEWGRLEFNAIKRSQGSFSPAKQPLLQLIETCPYFRAETYYMLGAMAYADRDYEEAQSQFDAYLHFPPASEEVLGKRRDKYVEEVREVMPNIAFELAFRENEGRYHPASIPPISTVRDEFLPALSPDGSLLFFTRRERYKAKGDVVSTESEVFYAAERAIGAEFNPGSALESPFNEGARYGGASISVDNRELFIAASNPTGSNPDNIDLYVTTYEIVDRDDAGDFFYVWAPLSPVDALNTRDGWEAQPALSADGNELFFAAVNAQSIQDNNGNPTMDIWRSVRGESGDWQPAERLPGPVNSNRNDKAPFLHPDGKTLYFASDRRPGGGGYDIWVCRRDDNGNWGEVPQLRCAVEHIRRRTRPGGEHQRCRGLFLRATRRHPRHGHHTFSCAGRHETRIGVHRPRRPARRRHPGPRGREALPPIRPIQGRPRDRHQQPRRSLRIGGPCPSRRRRLTRSRGRRHRL